uniref:Uncharacterized protein n=1 Tax=Arundo donax TaxID=35708 RepID=A0A0A9FQX9_ARUDO
MEWLGFRLNMLSNLVFAFSLALLVSVPEDLLNPSKLYAHRLLVITQDLIYRIFTCLMTAKLIKLYIQALLDLL